MNINTHQHCPATGSDTHRQREREREGERERERERSRDGKMERGCDLRGGVKNRGAKISELVKDWFRKHGSDSAVILSGAGVRHTACERKYVCAGRRFEMTENVKFI